MTGPLEFCQIDEQLNAPLAILGVGCYVPGAQTVDEYWSLLLRGEYQVRDLPEQLFHRELYFDPRRGQCGKTYCDQGGIIDRWGPDPKYHPVPQRLGEYGDTLVHMMCRAAADALNSAGRDPWHCQLPNTGVYIGCNSSGLRAGHQQYHLLAGHAGKLLASFPPWVELAGARGNEIAQQTVAAVRAQLPAADRHPRRMTTFHSIAHAVSEAYGLSGPSVVMDAVCSSSLKVLSVAQRDLTQGVADMALVGGAYTFNLETVLQVGMNQAATSGKSCPFADGADGIIASEAFLMLLVKPLSRAIADGDSIQGILKSIGISSDGKGKSTWAPRKEGQIEAIRRAYPAARELQRVAYLEAHATSTQVGDRTELESLQEVFSGRLPAKIPLGSVKANIGHPLEAAGLASLVKAMLVLQHKLVPQQIHCEPLNRHVDWSGLPFFVPRANTPLPSPADRLPRLAGINAFGIGGINAHAVLEEVTPVLWDVKKTVAVSAPSYGVPTTPLSQKTSATTPPAHCGADPVSLSTGAPIAIIGCGSVFPGARNLTAFRDLIFSASCAVAAVPDDRWCAHDPSDMFHHASHEINSTPDRSGGFVRDYQYDWKRHRISPKQIMKANPLAFMLVESVDQALADAGYHDQAFDRQQTEVIVGTNFESDFAAELVLGGRIPHFIRTLKETCRLHGLNDEARVEAVTAAFADYLLDKVPAITDELGTCVPSGLASRMAKIFDFMGGAASVDTGDTAALAALAQGVTSLRAGASRMVVCAVGARSVGLQMHAVRNRQQAGEDAMFRPPAEGAGTLLLKRLADAKRDGDKIRGVIHAIGTGFSTNPSEAFERAISRAWAMMDRTDGSLPPEAVEWVELSPASPQVRSSEISALVSFYKRYRSARPLPVGAVDGHIGDGMAASGMASTLKSSLQLDCGTLPAFMGHQPSVDSLPDDLAPHVCFPHEHTRIRPQHPQGRVLAAVSSYDTFGSAYHMILERGSTNPLQAATDGESCFPLLAESGPTSDGQWMAAAIFDPKVDRFLRDHQYRARPLLPTVILVETMAQAAISATSKPFVAEVQNLKIAEGLRFLEDTPKTAKIFLHINDQRVDCRFTVDFRNRRGTLMIADRVYSSGTVIVDEHRPPINIPVPGNLEGLEWYDCTYADSESVLFHGPMFRQLKRIAFGAFECWGECHNLSGTAAERDGVEIHKYINPSTFDSCLYLIIIAIWKRTGGVLGLPQSLERLRLGRLPHPDERGLIYAQVVQENDAGVTANLTLFGENRDVLLDLQGCYYQLAPTTKGKNRSSLPVRKSAS